MHIRELPLFNTPHLAVVILGEAARGATTVERCARQLELLLEQADEHPPVAADEIRRRIDRLRRHLAEAGLLSRDSDGSGDGDGRFVITERGRETLARHPRGLDHADLMVFPEYRAFVRDTMRERDRMSPHMPAYDRGFEAYGDKRMLDDNPFEPDTVDHLAWENGWFEALDEDVG